MTVLNVEKANEPQKPPRKKLCLSSSRRDTTESWNKSRKCSEGQSKPGPSSVVNLWNNPEKSTENNSFKQILKNEISSAGEMINSYDASIDHNRRKSEEGDSYSIDDYDYPPITPLVNRGNTCFLNSLLYTLRFAPRFLHKLHHLSLDSQILVKQLYANKQERTHSLGRNFTRFSIQEWSTSNTSCKEVRMQQLVEKLHHLYQCLSSNELDDSFLKRYKPDTFLQALREVNPIFEENKQHDAHELLVCLLDVIRETCQVLYQQNTILESQLSFNRSPPSSSSSTLLHHIKRSFKYMKKIGAEKEPDEKYENAELKTESENDALEDDKDGKEVVTTNNLQNTIFEDFQGESVLCTTCLECHQETERREAFCDISIPIIPAKNYTEYEDDFERSQLYHSLMVTEEYLSDNNRYFCDTCNRYTEAKQSTRYERLPRLLTLHLNRFSSSLSLGVSKVNEHMPTPFTLTCFCEECCCIEILQNRPHTYQLYAVIMHLGSSLASGHYIAYVRVTDSFQDYADCPDSIPKTSSLSRVHSAGGGTSSKNHNIAAHERHYTGGFLNNWNIFRKSQQFSKSMCRSIDCCSVRFQFNVESCDDLINDGGDNNNNNNNSVWLECDDESVRKISEKDFDDILNSKCFKVPVITPYLLFYSRC